MEYETDITKCECGWVGPKGQIYGLEHYSGSALDHERLAEEIIRNGEVKHDKDNIYNCVECKGWIKFSPDLIIAEAKPSDITQIQKDKIVDWLCGALLTKHQENNFIHLGFKQGLTNNCFSYRQIQNMDLLQFAFYVTNF